MTNPVTDPLAGMVTNVEDMETKSVLGVSGAALAGVTNAAAMMTTGLVDPRGNVGKRGVMVSSTKFMD